MRILVVEDEQKLCDQIQHFLADKGFAVDKAHNGGNGFFMGKEYLVTFHREPLRSINVTIDRVTKSALVARAPDRLTHTVLDFLFENYQPVLDALSASIAELEGQMLTARPSAKILADELAEETGLDGDRVEPLTVFHYAYPDRNVRLHAFQVTEPRGEVAIAGGRSWEWADPAGLATLPMPEANRAILRALAWRTGSTA